ncbi:MAG: PKD domain-containing protein [Holophagaceae bacterium]|nr:PKD domain-containing protein [Holophagaceae bacterium]
MVPVAGLVLFLGCNNGGAGLNDGVSLRKGNVAPTATLVGFTPADSPLVRYKPYTFTATAADPDIGDSITQYEWDFGDGTSRVTTSTGAATHVFNTAGTSESGAVIVQVRAYDASHLAGSWASLSVTVNSADSPITPTFQSPSGAVALQADASGGVLLTYTISVSSTSGGSIGLSNVNFNPGDSLATVVSSQSLGGGLFSFGVNYRGASASGPRTSYATVQVSDSTGISSAVVTGPAVTITTLSTTNHQPVIVVTNPATPTSSGLTTKPVDLAFTITDIDADVVNYTVNWGDGTPLTSATTTGDSSVGANVDLTHVFPDSFTASSRDATILINATDGRTNNGTATQQSRTFTITYNSYPAAAITSPQASATLPSPAVLPSNPSIGLMNPPGPNDPDLVVIPSGGKVSFSGLGTPPGSGESVSYSWTFQGGVPASSAQSDPGEVIFTANPGTITPLLAQLTVEDAYGRVSSGGPGVNRKTYQKWIIVDGQNTQAFKLSFLYRLKADNNGTSSVAPVVTNANGLGQVVSIFQDGLTNTYAVQDQSNQAIVSVPVRSNLPFYIQIPAFAPESISYLLRIPNSPTGPFRDPSLGTTLLTNTSTFGFENAAPPFNPTLKVVTAQGFAPEGQNPQERRIAGTTQVFGGQTPANNRWLDRLSVPLDNGDTLGALNQWVQGSNFVYGFNYIRGNQSFAEWMIFLKTLGTDQLAELPVPDTTSTPGTLNDLGFNLDYAKYSGDTQNSESFAATRMQAFRVPGGVTDPYDITLAGSGSPSLTVDLDPEMVAANVAPFFATMLYAGPGITPLAGGLQDLAIPYDANDPDRLPNKTLSYSFSQTRSVFSYSEYLWSSVWARPLVLNHAAPKYSEPIWLYPYFRRSNPAAWPVTTIGISPDNSQFDLTVSPGGIFDASSPVSIGGTPGTTGVGRFYWTAYTPFYNGAQDGVIARTWQADPDGQPPTTFDGISTDATAALGFVPPQDVVVDKRGRNANGELNGNPSGGYRVTWFNATTDSDSNPVPPDFWVVELNTGATPQHFLLPAGFPADAQSVADSILTDARTFLPSGRSASQGPAADGSDKVGPGYCWFDIPVELRPTAGQATLTVYALKSILRNNPVAGARPLNRPDWLDGLKTVTATISVKPLNGGELAPYRIPLNYYWDIVVTNSARVVVAP